MIDRKDWRTHGLAAHFIGSCDCRYRLCTVVGRVVVSTVGDYHPHSGQRDDGLSERASQIGTYRTYETMVFPVFDTPRTCTAGESCSCLGMPEADISRQLDSKGYNTAVAASAGHDAMCVEWSSDEKQEGVY